MQLSKLFSDLSYNELSNIAIGGNGSGSIPGQHHGRILTLTNQGLLDLFSRFRLAEKNVHVETQEGLTLYYLRVVHARSNLEPGYPKYIVDGPENLFTGDVVKILEVFDELGEAVSLNNALDADSLYTAGFDCLQVSKPVPTNAYMLIYQAQHPELVMGGDGILDLTQNIELPLALYGALRAWIGHKIFSSMNGPEHLTKGQELLGYYELTCQQSEKSDLHKAAETWPQDRFIANGWV